MSTIINICFIILGLLILIFVESLTGKNIILFIPPTSFPKLAGIGMILFALLSLIKDKNEGLLRGYIIQNLKISKHRLKFVLLIVFYYFLILWIGFILSTTIVMVIYLRLTGEKKLNLIIIPLITVISIYVFFHIIMEVQLPSGFFR